MTYYLSTYFSGYLLSIDIDNNDDLNSWYLLFGITYDGYYKLLDQIHVFDIDNIKDVVNTMSPILSPILTHSKFNPYERF